MPADRKYTNQLLLYSVGNCDIHESPYDSTLGLILSILYRYFLVSVFIYLFYDFFSHLISTRIEAPKSKAAI